MGKAKLRTDLENMGPPNRPVIIIRKRELFRRCLDNGMNCVIINVYHVLVSP